MEGEGSPLGSSSRTPHPPPRRSFWEDGGSGFIPTCSFFHSSSLIQQLKLEALFAILSRIQSLLSLFPPCQTSLCFASDIVVCKRLEIFSSGSGFLGALPLPSSTFSGHSSSPCPQSSLLGWQVERQGMVRLFLTDLFLLFCIALFLQFRCFLYLLIVGLFPVCRCSGGRSSRQVEHEI